jgi:hypothetical protein
MAERAVLHPQFEQERGRLADEGSGREAEQPHDLGAVQIRTDGGQLLLLLQLGDPALEGVVAAGQPLRLGLVPGRTVGPGQGVQAR